MIVTTLVAVVGSVGVYRFVRNRDRPSVTDSGRGRPLSGARGRNLPVVALGAPSRWAYC